MEINKNIYSKKDLFQLGFFSMIFGIIITIIINLIVDPKRNSDQTKTESKAKPINILHVVSVPETNLTINEVEFNGIIYILGIDKSSKKSHFMFVKPFDYRQSNNILNSTLDNGLEMFNKINTIIENGK